MQRILAVILAAGIALPALAATNGDVSNFTHRTERANILGAVWSDADAMVSCAVYVSTENALVGDLLPTSLSTFTVELSFVSVLVLENQWLRCASPVLDRWRWLQIDPRK